MCGFEEIIRIFNLQFTFFFINLVPITSGILRMKEPRNQYPIAGLLEVSKHIFMNLSGIFLNIPLGLADPLLHNSPILAIVLRNIEII
jgi:hypothetical protein